MENSGGFVPMWATRRARGAFAADKERPAYPVLATVANALPLRRPGGDLVGGQQLVDQVCYAPDFPHGRGPYHR